MQKTFVTALLLTVPLYIEYACAAAFALLKLNISCWNTTSRREGGGGTNVTTQNCHLDDPSSLIAMIDDLTYLMPSGYWLHLHCFVHMSALWRMKVTGASHKWEKMKTRILKMWGETKQYCVDIILNSCKDFVRRLNAWLHGDKIRWPLLTYADVCWRMLLNKWRYNNSESMIASMLYVPDNYVALV
jgi:hypothetical protein